MKIKVEEMRVNTKLPVKTFAIITCMTVILFPILIWIATRGALKVYVFKDSEKIQASIFYSGIEETSKKTDNIENFHRVIRYSYNINGKSYTGEENLWWKILNSSIGCEEGDEITVYYNKDKPEESSVWHISYFLIVFATIALLMSIMALIKRIEYEKNN